MRPLIVYWNNLPAPYMVDRFNALAECDKLNFEVWFNDREVLSRNWGVDESSWKFPFRYLPSLRFFGHVFHWPTPILKKNPAFIVCLHSEPVFVAGWFLAKFLGIKTGFRVLNTYDSWVQRNPIKDAIKRFMFRRTDAFETPGNDGRKFALRYGAPADRIFLATHAVDIPHFKKGSIISSTVREELRSQLGLCGIVFIYVGRLWDGKGVNYLIDAFGEVQQRSEDEVSLLLVGSGIDEQNLQRQCLEKNIYNVKFAGFHQKAELPRYYATADVFVFPTLGDPYGLAVDEAMACSLPVISTSEVGEIRDRIEEGANGYIVPPEDSTAMAERMFTLVCNSKLREKMGKLSYEKIKDHTPEKWAKDFVHIAEQIMIEKLDK